MKILVTKANQPIIDIRKGISAGEKVKFGIYRNRHPDADWGQISQVNLEMIEIKEVDLTKELKEILIGDLAYLYGTLTERFISKLKEFKIV